MTVRALLVGAFAASMAWLAASPVGAADRAVARTIPLLKSEVSGSLVQPGLEPSRLKSIVGRIKTTVPPERLDEAQLGWTERHGDCAVAFRAIGIALESAPRVEGDRLIVAGQTTRIEKRGRLRNANGSWYLSRKGQTVTSVLKLRSPEGRYAHAVFSAAGSTRASCASQRKSLMINLGRSFTTKSK